MWMWFNDALMELENFNRGHKPDKKKAIVLYKAILKRRPPALRYLPTISHSMQHDDAWVYGRRISEPRLQLLRAALLKSSTTAAQWERASFRSGPCPPAPRSTMDSCEEARPASAASPPLPSPFLSFPILSLPILREVFSSGTVDTISQVEDRDEEARAVRSRGSGPGHLQPLLSSLPLLRSSGSRIQIMTANHSKRSEQLPSFYRERKRSFLRLHTVIHTVIHTYIRHSPAYNIRLLSCRRYHYRYHLRCAAEAEDEPMLRPPLAWHRRNIS